MFLVNARLHSLYVAPAIEDTVGPSKNQGINISAVARLPDNPCHTFQKLRGKRIALFWSRHGHNADPILNVQLNDVWRIVWR